MDDELEKQRVFELRMDDLLSDPMQSRDSNLPTAAVVITKNEASSSSLAHICFLITCALNTTRCFVLQRLSEPASSLQGTTDSLLVSDIDAALLEEEVVVLREEATGNGPRKRTIRC